MMDDHIQMSTAAAAEKGIVVLVYTIYMQSKQLHLREK